MTAAYGTIARVDTGARTNVTQALPSGTANGNLLLWNVVTGNNPAVTPTFPAGWTTIGTSITESDAGGFFFYSILGWRIASSEPADYTATHSACSSESLMIRITGTGTLSVDASSAQDHGDAGFADGSATTTALSVTPTAADDLLVFIGLNWDEVALSPPTGMTERQDAEFIYLATQALASSSATGDRTQTHSSAPWYGYLVAVKDTAGGAPYTLAANGGTYAVTGTAATLLPTGVWTFVGVSAAPTAATASPLTLTEPADVRDGDLLVACIASRSTATTAPSNTGWTAVNSINVNNTLTSTSALASGCMLYQVRNGTPDLTFTLPAGISVATGHIVAYRGNQQTTPLDVSSAVATGTNTTSVNVAGQTTTVANDLIVAMAAGGQEAAWTNFRATTPSTGSGATDTTSHPSSSAWTERADTVTTQGADTSIGIFDAIKTTAGATGNFLTTASQGAGHVIISGSFRLKWRKVAAEAGSYAVTGATATLTKSSASTYTVAADGGTYAASGTAADLERGREVEALGSSYAASGTTSSLELGREVAADGSSYAVNGTASSLEFGREVAAAGGSYAVSGTAADLEFSRKVVADGGTYALTGAAATLTKVVTRTIAADGGSYALTGTTATLTYSGEAPAVPPAFRSVANTSYGSNAGSTVCNAPAGVTDGDILVAGIMVAKGSVSIANTDEIGITPPAGWTQIGTQTKVYDGSGFGGTFWVFWKRAASEGSTYTFTHVSVGGDFGTTFFTQAAIAAYSDCVASGDPVDVFSQNASPTVGTVSTGTGVTATVANTKLLYAGHNWDGSNALTPPTGMTERFDSIVYLSDETRASAGATGDRTQTQASNSPWAAFLVALKPAAGGAPTAYTLDAAAGSYALTGATATLTETTVRTLAADAGSYALAGADATLTYSFSKTVVAGAGSYDIAGTAATLLHGGLSAPPVFRSFSSTSYGNRTNTTIAIPADTRGNDILLCGMFIAQSGVGPSDVTPPAGWTQISVETEVVLSDFYAEFYVFWKRASGEGTDYTFSHATALTQAEILSYSGCFISGDPIDVFSTTFGNSNNNTSGNAVGDFWIEYASIAPTRPNTELVLLSHNWEGSGTLTPPRAIANGAAETVMVERYDNLVYAADQDWPSAGATGIRAMMHNSSGPFAGFLLALKPATGGLAYRFDAEVGGYAVTGTPVSPIYNRKAAANAATYAVSGATASLIYSGAAKSITASGGSYALAGTAAAFTHIVVRRVAADGGSYALGGTAATFAKVGNKTITAEANTYALGGTSAALIENGVVPPPLFLAVSNTSYASRSETVVAVPTGTTDGDILLAGFFILTSTGTPPGDVTPPAGWTQVGAETEVNQGSFNGEFYLFWKRASGEGANYTFSHETANTQVEILAYSDCITSGNPIDAYSVTFGNTNNNTVENASGSFWVDYTSVTATTANTKLVLLSHNWDGSAALTPPGPAPGPTVLMTERYDNLVYAADEDRIGGGPTGIRTMRHESAAPFAGYLVVLKPVLGITAHAMTADPSTYTVSGTDAALSKGGDKIVLADGGTYSITGTAATLTKGSATSALPSFRSVSSIAYGSGRTATPLAKPSGTVANDLLVAVIFAGRSGATPTDPVPPSGWTQINAAAIPAEPGFFGNCTVWWLRATGSGPETYTWTHPEAASTQGTVTCYSNVLAVGNPIDASSMAIGDSQVATAASITTTVANTKLIYTGNNWTGAATLSPPTGMTERFDGLVYLADSDAVAAGASGTKTQAVDAGGGGTPWSAFLIALKPGAGATYTVAANAGTYSISGTAVSLERGRFITLLSGTYALSGTAATLTYVGLIKRLAAEAGVYAIAGTATSLERGRKVDAVGGSYALAGTAATFRILQPTAPPIYRSMVNTGYITQTNTTVAKPTGTAERDLLLCGFFIGAVTLPGDVTPPSGWTQIDVKTAVVDAGGFDGEFYAFWKRATSSEGASYTFTHGSAATQAVMLAYSGGVISGNPIDTYSRSFANTGQSATYTGVTVSINDAKLVLLAHNWDGDSGRSPPGAMAERLDSIVYASDEDRDIGATGNLVQVLASSNPWAGYLVVLKPRIGTTATILNTDTGSYALTGSQAQLVTSGIAAGSGSYVITGTPSLVGHGFIVAGGTYALTGTAATLITRARYVVAASGTYAITGTPASTGRGFIVVGGSYGIGGATATFKRNRRIAAVGGTYAIVGNPATLLKSSPGAYTLVANGGSYGVSGTAANLKLGRWTIAATGGSYTVTGAAALLHKNHSVSGQQIAVWVGTVVVNIPNAVSADTNLITIQTGTVTIAVHKAVQATGTDAMTVEVGSVGFLFGQAVRPSTENDPIFVDVGTVEIFCENLFSTIGTDAMTVEVGSVEVSTSVIVEEEIRWSGFELTVNSGSVNFVLSHRLVLDGLTLTVRAGRAFSPNWGAIPEETADRWTSVGAGTSENWAEQDRPPNEWTRIIGHG